jgi:hypothetical protein
MLDKNTLIGFSLILALLVGWAYFLKPSDEEILAVVNNQHKLTEFLERKNFKTYEELKAKLDSVLSGESNYSTAESMINDPLPIAEARSIPSAQAPAPVASKAPEINEDDDVMSFFQKIADEA